MTIFISARIDEAGTDGSSEYAVAAGGVAIIQHWNKIEGAWDRLMNNRGVGVYHSKEFNNRKGDFKGWSRLKCDRFIKAQEKIIRNSLMTIAVAVNIKEHANVKKELRGIKGFKADSDAGICFRMLRFYACKKIAEQRTDAKISFIVEDGPYSADMGQIYQDVINTIGAKYQPAKFADMLNGFAHVPKGRLRSLEIADYIAGQSVTDIKKGIFVSPGRPEQISRLITPDSLRYWHEKMIEERKKRQNYGTRPNLSQTSS